MNVLAISIGGAIGAALRYSISLLIPYETGFPVATFFTNCLGCFLLALLLSGPLLNRYTTIKLALTTGLLGAFTTFSTFSAETVHLLQQEQWLIAIVYVFTSLGAGLLCSMVGYLIGRRAEK